MTNDQNDPNISAYVALSARPVARDPESALQHHVRLDQLWYGKMPLDDRTADSEASYPIAAPEVTGPLWREISVEGAAKRCVWLEGAS